MKEFDKLPEWKEYSFTYAGIGSRDIRFIKEPTMKIDMAEAMKFMAGILEQSGYTLNSGGAKGSDSAFESGVTKDSMKNIFYASSANERTRAIAKEIHPAPHMLSGYILDLMARNTYQIFGKDLDTPVDFVLCYTKDGCEHHSQRTRETGGTGQAIEMASRKGIPVINMANKNWEQRVYAIMNEALKTKRENKPKAIHITISEPTKQVKRKR